MSVDPTVRWTAANGGLAFFLAPLIIMWFGLGLESKIVMVSLICFFPVLVNTFAGLRQADEKLIEFYQAYGASRVWCRNSSLESRFLGSSHQRRFHNFNELARNGFIGISAAKAA